MSAPNTSPCISPDTSPCPKTSSCAGGTLSARVVPRHKHIQSARSRKVTESAGKGLSQLKPPLSFSASAASSISHSRLSARNAFSSRFAISASKNDVFPNRALFSPCNAAISLPRSMYRLTVIYSASSSPATAYVKNLLTSAKSPLLSAVQSVSPVPVSAAHSPSSGTLPPLLPTCPNASPQAFS